MLRIQRLTLPTPAQLKSGQKVIRLCVLSSVIYKSVGKSTRLPHPTTPPQLLRRVPQKQANLRDCKSRMGSRQLERG